MAAACASRALWAALTRPPNPARAPAAPRAVPRARAPPPSDGDAGGGRDNHRRRPRAHGPHAPDVNLHWRAKNLERAGDRLGALRLLTTALELYPTNAHIGVSAARLVAENVDGRGASTALDDALAIAERCAEHDPNNAVVANLRATLEAKRGGKGAAARARALFARSVELNPAHAAAYHAWAVFERSRGRVAKARRLFRECRVADPTRAATSQAWALLEVDDRNFAEARRLFQDAVALDESHAPSWQAWADTERRLGNVGKAERLFRKGEEATRDAARGITGAASGTRVRRAREANAANARDLGGGRRAKEPTELDGDETSGVDNNSAGGAKTRTSRRSRLGGGGGSRAKLRARSSLLCSWASFEVARGSPTSGQRGDGYNMPLARTLFREAVDTCPENAQAWTQWWKAEAMASRGGSRSGGLGGSGFGRLNPNSSEGAERQLAVANEGLAKCPGNERLRHARALSLKSLGDTAGARHELEALARDFPANAHAAHSLGLLLQELGEFDAAVSAFERGKDASLPCLTAAAAAASHSGDVARARGLFMEGSAVASSGGARGRVGGFGPGVGSNDGGSSAGTVGSGFFGSLDDSSFGVFDGSFVDAAAVDGAGAAYASPGSFSSSSSSSRGGGVSSSSSSAQPSSSFGERMRTATRRDCSAHLRLWALLEKRDGAETVARTLFQRATDVDPTDGATWLQWGQFERRVSGAAAARSRFELGLAKCDSSDPYAAYLYQAWATMEAAEGDDAMAADLFADGTAAHPRAATLWLERGLFEASRGDVKAARRSFETGIETAPDYPPVFEALARLEFGEGNESRAEEVARAGGLVPPAVGARREETEDAAAAAAAAGREVTF